MLMRDIIMVAATQSGGAAISQYAAWPPLIGAERIVNGDCSSGTGWVLGAGVAIAAGKMTATASTDDTQNTGVIATLLADAVYRCVFTIDSRAAGTARITTGSIQGTIRSTTGTFSEDLNAGDGGDWFLGLNTATMQLDNFSVKSVGLLGVEADWTFSTGNVFWNSDGTISFDGPPSAGESASLTGTAKTDFDAAVSNSTACTVTIYFPDAAVLTGTITIAMKGGTAVNFVGDGVVTSISHTVTSGTGSGFVMASGSDSPAGQILRVQIALA